MMKLKRTSSSTVAAKPSLAYEIVSDYANYVQWLPGLLSSHVLAQESNFAIVEFEFAANPGIKLTLECIHAPTSMVVLRSLSGNKPSVKIEWAITGESGQTTISLKMQGPISPPFLAGYKGFFDPKKGVNALAAVVAASGDGPTGEKVIEIMETEEGLVCWYRGTRYRMEAIS